MLAYNPGVYDRSGEIIAEGTNRASEIQLQSMSNMGENIGNFIAQIGDAYSERKQLEAKASSYDDIGKILGTAMFSDNADATAALGNLQKEKDPRKKVMGYETLFSLVGPMSNMMMAQGRLGVQQNAPFVDQYLDTQNDIASGNRTFTPTGGGGMPAPVEPPLPTDEPTDTPPPVQSSPAAPAASMPGGAQSREALNRWRASQGLPPI